MFISAAAKSSGVTVKTIRYYEELGLLDIRRSGAYRVFTRREIARIRLIRQARELGFSISEIQAARHQVVGDGQWSAILRLLGEKRVQITGEIELLEEKQRLLDDYARAIDRCLADDPEFPGPLD